MDEYTLPEHSRSALIVIDMQRDFLDGGLLEVRGASEIVPHIVRVLDLFRRAHRPIIHVVRLYPEDGSDVDLCRRRAVMEGSRMLAPDSDGSQLAAPHLPERDIVLDADLLLSGGLQPLGPQEWVMYKPRWGAFYRTPLENHLRSMDVSTLVFVGCNYPNCPRASIYEASERDFRIVVLGDAVAGLYPTGVSELRNVGCYVVDTEDYLHEVVEEAHAADSALEK